MSKSHAPQPAEFLVASHEALFACNEPPKCDACDACLATQDSAANTTEHAQEDEGYGVPGSGAYLWMRGDRVSTERVPLCASCASAIGMTALARWEIEEEEG